jgi:DNA-binding GntR family transcriptional regulator
VGRVDGGMQRASGAQLVYGELRERILNLSLEPGARLHEAELAAELRVSRTPLREALRMLLAEDLVEQLPTGGMLVRRLDLQDMRELYAVRAALESLAAREACQRLTDADLDVLESLVEQMRLLVDHPAELTRLGGEFHARIAAIAGNRRCEPRRRAALEDHRALFEALRARDPEAAERTVRDHVLAACREGEAAAAGLLSDRR